LFKSERNINMEALKAEELMVGDWIIVYEKAMPVKARVDGVYGNNAFVLGHPRTVANGFVNPIPLTPEILEKNGFIKDEDDEYQKTYHLLVPTGFEKDSYTIKVTLYTKPICGVNVLFKCWGSIPPYNGGLNDIHLCSISFVHQMQHALRLCGINKTIEL